MCLPDLTVTLIQAELVWEDIAANLAGFDARLDAMTTATDLVVLPEMFSTGFTMNASKVAEAMDGLAVRWMQARAKQRDTVLAGSLVIEEQGKYFNRFVWASPNGEIATYDKRHLFRLAGEEKVYHAGDCMVTVDLKGWKIRPFICYDLRFPVWTRNWSNGYDVGLFVANWPEKRAAHWKALLSARAIENQCFVIGVNRVGTDGNGDKFNGGSMALDPAGRFLAHKTHTVCEATVTLERDILDRFRREFPVWRDADHEMLSPALRAQIN